VIAILALSATVAQAGSGGFPTTLLGFFVCHQIAGDNPGLELDVKSMVFGPFDSSDPDFTIRQRVQIGTAALACAWAKVFPPPTKADPAPDPIDPGPFAAEQMTCYPITKIAKNVKFNPPPLYSKPFGDALVGPDEVRVPPTGLTFLCAPGGYFAQ
jgi:hypothetical protein